jgi:hypothetical protein
VCHGGHSVGQRRNGILATEFSWPCFSNFGRGLTMHCGNAVVTYLSMKGESLSYLVCWRYAYIKTHILIGRLDVCITGRPTLGGHDDPGSDRPKVSFDRCFLRRKERHLTHDTCPPILAFSIHSRRQHSTQQSSGLHSLRSG